MIDIQALCAQIAHEHKIASAIGDMEVKTETIPSDKNGFDFQVTYVNNVEVKREYVKNDSFVEPLGDYLNPIPFEDGMAVEAGKWYTDGLDIWEAKADGIPFSFADMNYFDIIA